jgi:hypothetical protein
MYKWQTVVEVVEKYNLHDFEKSYFNQYGMQCNLIPLNEFVKMEVKSINIHFPTNSVSITIIQDI